MNAASKKAILIVSFGTSYENTRKRTIDAIERDIADAFPACPAYRAWTSKMIIAKLKKRDGIIIHTVKEAMEQMLLDGITDVIVQPTHVINGIENDQMKADALSFRDRFSSIVFGNPLSGYGPGNSPCSHGTRNRALCKFCLCCPRLSF